MRKARGFTIIELLVVLVIVSLMVAMAAMVTRAITSQQRRSLTATRMQGVDAAIVQYVQQQRRLPCPADGSIASAGAGAGTEMARNAAGCTTDQSMGVVPWVTLGLTEADATDGWERRMTYRLQSALAADNAMDMSSCDPAGTGGLAAGGLCLPLPGCSNATLGGCTAPATFLNNKGLLVQTVPGVVTMNPAGAPPTGAAYVVLSHGESGGGGYLNSGQQYATITTDGTEEQKNYANLALRAPPLYYVDDSISDAPVAATHFDDIVSRPSVLNVITKAGLGPRSH